MSEYQDQDERKPMIKKMEDMLKGRSSYYFDVDEFLAGSDYFIENNKIKNAKELLIIALDQHPRSSELLVQQAQVLSMQEKYAEALALIEEAENLEPSNKDLLLIRAEIMSGCDKHKEAIQLYLQYIEESDDKEYLDVIYNDLAWEYETQNDYKNALECLKKALEFNKQDDSLLFEIAYFYEVLNLLEESIIFYQDYIDEHPYSYNAWYNIGNVYNDLELYEKAVEAFDFSIVIKEDFASAYFNKGNAFFKLGEYEKAIDSYISTFEFEENQAITYCYIGEAFEKLGKIDDAEKSYILALEIDPKNVDALIGLTIVKDLQEKTIEGLPFIEKATEIYPNNFESWYIKAEVHEKIERFNDARLAYEKAFEIDAKNTDLLLNYSNFIAEQDSVNEAIELIKENATIEIKYRQVAYLILLGKFDEAKELLENCMQTDYSKLENLIKYYPKISELAEFVVLMEKYKED